MEKWRKVGDSWFQKQTVNKSGIPIYQYSYCQKNSNDQKCFVLKINNTKELCGYLLIEQDIISLTKFFEEYKKAKSSRNSVLTMALTNAIIIALIKCFKKEKARGVSIDEKSLSVENRKIYEGLLHMRRKGVAHSDKSIYENCEVVYLIPPESKYKKKKVVTAIMAREIYHTISIDDVDKIKPLLNEMAMFVKNKIKILEDEINKRLEKICADKVYKKYKKCSENRIVINEKSLKAILK